MADAPSFLPYGRHAIDADDEAAVLAALRSGQLTQGPAVAGFEADLCARTGAAHAVVVNSGTAALHLAVLAAGLGAGDVAIVPALTFLATANAVRLAGAEVVFADVDPHTGLMGPEHLADALARAGGKAKAVLPVHLNGQACDLAAIAAVAEAAGLQVIDDACHALGGAVRSADGTWIPVGSGRLARMTAFSFHPVKAIAMGEGGAVTTNDSALADHLRRLRSHGMTKTGLTQPESFDPRGEPNPWIYEMPELGLNYRASDLNCALAASQLRKLDGFIARRAALADRYDALLAPLASLVRPVPRAAWARQAWHLYAVAVDFAAAGHDRAAVMKALAARGIGTQVHYLPVSHQPYYRARYGAIALPGADAYYRRALSLPLFVQMADADTDRVVDALAAVLGA